MAPVVATLGPGHPSDWCPLNPCQGRGQAWLRVCMCQAAPPSAVTPRQQTGLTANLQGFRIRAPEGWPLFQRRVLVLACGTASMRSAPRIRREPGAAVARPGPKATGRATGSVPGSGRGPACYGEPIRRARDSGLVVRRFCMCGGQPARRALRALEYVVQEVLTAPGWGHARWSTTMHRTCTGRCIRMGLAERGVRLHGARAPRQRRRLTVISSGS